MTIPDKAADFAIEFANDDSHGYDQGNRLGNPDTDCSWLVIMAYKHAGLTDLTATYTGNMKWDFLQHGFRDVKKEVNIVTGMGLKRGDVLLNETHHAAIYIGNNQVVEATGNEFGGVIGGQPGDQTGKEIAINPYHDYGWGMIGWDCVLRYEGDSSDDSTPDTYVVKEGDTLWQIAVDHGMDVYELVEINNLDMSKFIYPGQILKLKRSESDQNGSKFDNTYVVKSGDSLWQIAANKLGNGWSWYKIANENNIKFPYTIYPGQILKIPEKE